ncbi:MAG: hypothetical protein AB7D38_12030 [Sulfurimonas sp.]|uniref:hypothetical protein n=1 Tax=Sulfurimonas sp. TaxID=2022749 RepID=UPI003D0BC755
MKIIFVPTTAGLELLKELAAHLLEAAIPFSYLCETREDGESSFTVTKAELLINTQNETETKYMEFIAIYSSLDVKAKDDSAYVFKYKAEIEAEIRANSIVVN